MDLLAKVGKRLLRQYERYPLTMEDLGLSVGELANVPTPTPSKEAAKPSSDAVLLERVAQQKLEIGANVAENKRYFQERMDRLESRIQSIDDKLDRILSIISVELLE